MSRSRKTLAVILVNTALTLALLLVAEIGYRIHADGFVRAYTNIVSGVPYSSLGTSNWVIFDDDLGYRLNPDRPNINSRSVRHQTEIAIPKPPGLFRVIVLGDSIPWDQDGFVSGLTQRLDGRGNYEVINASVPGYTSFQEITFFKRYLADAEADLLIWSYCLNDNYKFLHQFNEEGRMLWTREAMESLEIHTAWDHLVSRSYILSSLRLMYVAAQRERSDRQVSKYRWETKRDFNIAWKDFSWRAYEGHLREMIELLRERQTKLAIIIFPWEPQLTHRHDENLAYVTKPQRLMSGLCEKYAIPCLDMFPHFSASYDDRGGRMYRDGVHLTPAGHEFTATLLTDFLERHRLVPAS